MPRLGDVCRHIRSKNAGPFWVTIDLFFDGPQSYLAWRDDPAIGATAIAELYGADAALVRRYAVDSLNVVKLSLPRRQPQGGVLERDMHSGQQYIPLLQVELGRVA
ncbi:MAG TPA: DUF4387 domain-containing protein [Caulobacteraceae bacterium]|nr:DUF4387 domain-containing protein [Caulobacteraceae bacterium]